MGRAYNYLLKKEGSEEEKFDINNREQKIRIADAALNKCYPFDKRKKKCRRKPTRKKYRGKGESSKRKKESNRQGEAHEEGKRQEREETEA